MNLAGKTLIMGDLHGDFGRLNSFVNKKRPAIILQTGDFGYWPRLSHKALYGRRNPKYKDPVMPKMPEETNLYWCDGNHEDHHALIDRVTDELYPRVHYMPRGSTFELPDGRIVLFMGGALSIDRNCRLEGGGNYGWFPEEQVRESNVMDLDIDRVDIVISHTCPQEFDVPMRYEYNDSSRLALSYILHNHKPKQWFCGHWHHFCTGEYIGCKWTAMGRFDSGGPGGWIELG